LCRLAFFLCLKSQSSPSREHNNLLVCPPSPTPYLCRGRDITEGIQDINRVNERTVQQKNERWCEAVMVLFLGLVQAWSRLLQNKCCLQQERQSQVANGEINPSESTELLMGDDINMSAPGRLRCCVYCLVRSPEDLKQSSPHSRLRRW